MTPTALLVNDEKPCGSGAFDGETGALTMLGSKPIVAGPSSVAVDPQIKHLYVTSESGSVTTFALDVSSGKLVSEDKVVINASSIVLASPASATTQGR